MGVCQSDTEEPTERPNNKVVLEYNPKCKVKYSYSDRNKQLDKLLSEREETVSHREEFQINCIDYPL